MTTAAHFYALAIMVGMVQGGTQALSRSLFASMIPRHKSSEFFAFFGVFERYAGILGPLVFAAMVDATGQSRNAMLAVLGFFVIGGAILIFVDVEAGRRAARQAEAGARLTMATASEPGGPLARAGRRAGSSTAPIASAAVPERRRRAAPAPITRTRCSIPRSSGRRPGATSGSSPSRRSSTARSERCSRAPAPIPVYRKIDQGVDTSKNVETFAAVSAAFAAGDADLHLSRRDQPLDRTAGDRSARARARMMLARRAGGHAGRRSCRRPATSIARPRFARA